MQADFDALRNFDYDAAKVSFWVFKKSAKIQGFTAHYVQTDLGLSNLLLGLVKQSINGATTQGTGISEFAPYSYLAEVNENSCLSLPIEGERFALLKAQVDRPADQCMLESKVQLYQATGYVVKLKQGDQAVYAVKRSSSAWKPSFHVSVINLIFKDGVMSAVEDDTLTIKRNFDFYCVNATLFIASKRDFESTMEYRTAFTGAFATLLQTKDFANLFVDTQPLADYIGENMIHLRRMATVQQRNIFSQPDFLKKLKEVNTQRGWGLNFEQGSSRIIACPSTTRTIMQVLLDHRLLSEITSNVYDVPDATKI